MLAGDSLKSHIPIDTIYGTTWIFIDDGGIGLRLFLPIEHPETLVVMSLDRTWEIRSDDGWFPLPDALGERETFSLLRAGTLLCKTSTQALSNTNAMASVVSCETSTGQIDCVPMNRTRIFYADDPEVTLVINLKGLQADLPATLSWYFEEQFQFGLWSVMPKGHGPDARRTFAHGMSLTADTPKGLWFASLRLLTGLELHRAEVRIMERRRGSYEAPLSLLR